MSAAEQSVIGAVMLDASAYWQVADVIDASDFGDERNAAIFGMLAELCEAGKPSDTFIIGERIPELQAYAFEVANSTASVSSARGYAEMVRADSERRKVVIAGRRMALEAPTFAEAQSILASVAPRNGKATKSVSELLPEVMDDMQSRLDAEGSITGLSTGLRHLDRRTSGLQPGCLYIIAARPSMGKTARALQIAVNVTLNGGRVFVAEMEMTGKGLTERAVSYVSGVDYGLIRHPKMLREEHWPRIVDATGKLQASGLIIDDTPGQTGEAVIAKARQLHMQAPLSLMVVDHLGLYKLPGRGRPDLETGHITKGLKSLAKKLNIPVICLVQLNRKVEDRQDKRPMLSDLRESGAIEEDADFVEMIYRDEYYHPDSPFKGYAEVLTRKNRDGETGMDPYHAHLNRMHFADAEELPSVPTKPRQSHGRFGRKSFRGLGAPED